MTIRQLKELLPTLSDKERIVIKPLLDNLTSQSRTHLLVLQDEWKREDARYEDFIVAQNDLILQLLEWELSDSGTQLRSHQGLPLLTEDTDISSLMVSGE
jgi:hypothetical protein